MKEKFGYNSRYLTRDERPWFPVMGEMHYSRYREDLWEESLRKMKAGGVTIVSAYVIWIHHEEEEGIFDFSGCRCLKKFLEACQKVGLEVFLRLGPWVHGEVRNGGFPDWLQKKEKEGVLLRSNDEVYMGYVRRYWEQVSRQAEGFMKKDGGPVIGVQIENEYGHVGGLRGEAGEAHIRALTALAKELGFEVPLYTATGWGGACIGDLLPVMGGYCEAPWDQRTTEIEPNANYVFSHVRNDSLIACDHHVEDALSFDESEFPFLTAELGGGLQVTAHRRPVAQGKDIGAMSVTKLGSGVAMLGYYMYHGGSNPEGKLSTLQESRATGYLNDLPEISYDFNAPIRQYGTISDNLKEIKLLAYFLQDFGEDFAPLEAEIEPEGVRPEDFDTLRTSCRHDEKHGYVFYNNYVRRRTMADHERVVLRGICDENVAFPAVDIKDGDYGFFPYNMRLGDAVLKSALASPLCRLHTKEGDTWVFYGDRQPQFEWEGERQADVLHLSRQEALNAWRVGTDREYLILSDNFVWEEDGSIRAEGGARTVIRCYPKPSADMLPGFTECGQEGRFTVYERNIGQAASKAFVELISTDAEKAVYEITVSYPAKEDRRMGRDTFLKLAYAGDRMDICLGDKKVNDYFYTGQEALLSLGYFDFPETIRVIVYELEEGEHVFLEKWPKFTEGRACSLDSVEVIEEFR